MTEPSNAHYEYTTGPSAYHYWASQALATGAVNQWTKHTTYENCTFNNNGVSNYVVSCGLLSVNESKKTSIKYCEAENNGFYGFVDDGVFQDPQVNAQNYYLGCLSISNGENNSVAKVVQSDGFLRNCRGYYSTGFGSESPPFINVKFESYTEFLENSNPYINVSIRETS